MVARDGSGFPAGCLSAKNKEDSTMASASTSAAGPDVNMVVLAAKMSRGSRLTQTDQSIIISNATRTMAAAFGPMPENMPMPEIKLPESVKGVLASYKL